MRLYHFLKQGRGLEALSNQRIKLSRIDDLNDPFELFSIDMSSSSMFRQAMRGYKSYLASKLYLGCFSKTWKSPLLWSHYADRHKGMALELEVADEIVEEITYQKSRIKLDGIEKLKNKEDTTRKLLTTKYVEWAYEDEARIFVPPDQVIYEGVICFRELDSKVSLRSLILAPLSSLTDRQIRNELPDHTEIRVVRTRMAFREFHVVRDKSKRLVQIKNA